MRRPHARVQRALLEKLIVGGAGDDAPVIDNGDLVCAHDRREPMRDHDEGLPLGQPAHRLLDDRLVLRIGIGGGLIEHHDRGVFHHRAGEGDPLALPAGQMPARSADDGAVPLGKPLDELMAAAGLRAGDHLVVGRSRSASPDVFHHRLIEQEVVLRDVGDQTRHLGEGHFSDIGSPDEQRARPDIPKRGDELGDRRLSGTGGADERHGRSLLDGEAYVLERRRVPIGEPDVAKLDSEPVDRRGFVGAIHLRLFENLSDFVHDDGNFGDVVREHDCGEERPHDSEREHGDGDEGGHRERPVQDEQAPDWKHADEHRRPHAHHDRRPRQRRPAPIDHETGIRLDRIGELPIRRRALAERLDDFDAVDVLDDGGAHVAFGGDDAPVLLGVVPHLDRVAAEPHGDGGERDERHAPIYRELDRDDGQRDDHVGGHLGHHVGERNLQLLGSLHERGLELARRGFQHVSERHAVELSRQGASDL